MLGMHLNEQDISFLINKYKQEPDLVKYIEFCTSIDA